MGENDMNLNFLLGFMLFSYLLPILFVFYNYNSNNSVSNIICNNNCRNYILFFMFLMGIGTLLYEYERNDFYSQIIIFILLSGLYGLIYINESHKIHYFFAFLVFIAILFFMIRHCYLKKCNSILLLSLYFEIVALLVIMIDINKNTNIFYSEIFYILNFAFFYLYLHFMK